MLTFSLFEHELLLKVFMNIKISSSSAWLMGVLFYTLSTTLVYNYLILIWFQFLLLTFLFSWTLLILSIHYNICFIFSFFFYASQSLTTHSSQWSMLLSIFPFQCIFIPKTLLIYITMSPNNVSLGCLYFLSYIKPDCCCFNQGSPILLSQLPLQTSLKHTHKTEYFPSIWRYMHPVPSFWNCLTISVIIYHQCLYPQYILFWYPFTGLITKTNNNIQ